jgi:hypothetical protein
MLPSKLSPITRTNIFGKIWPTHKSWSSLSTSSKGQTLRFHTLKSIQGLEIDLDEDRRVPTMFQQVVKYNVQMTNILHKLFNLEIRNK